jgi:hypothetical protein
LWLILILQISLNGILRIKVAACTVGADRVNVHLVAIPENFLAFNA